ncbi:unnamed protein product [Lepeophtheirus salmonis]|uniref:(salmon louse) hypothetical protein n=1 Tax=Lepeophtheirus salmonis TaxID=72036 RepID=A0A7R8D9C4_LEPSM|nr:unnamed protein product [Lepeophtheirus salmonis]CAF3043893.1 unnamed protein product [Lepeophtheirus salmonis]
MIKWRCRKYREDKCLSVANTMEGKDKISRIIYMSSHNHLVGIREAMVMEVVEEQLQNASKNLRVPPRRVMLDISNKLQNIHCNPTSKGFIQLIPQSLKETSAGVRLLLFADYIRKDVVKGNRGICKMWSIIKEYVGHGPSEMMLDMEIAAIKK